MTDLSSFQIRLFITAQFILTVLLGAAVYCSVGAASGEAADFAGYYEFNNHRENKGGSVNSLRIESAGEDEIHVFREGTNFFMAGKTETFHEASAYGDLKIIGNAARGVLYEDETENECHVALTFEGKKIFLKSTNCNINVLPDGTYKKAVEPKADAADESEKPFIEYDDAGEASAVVNMMMAEGEREGCGEKELTFTGKVMKAETASEYDYEFTLAGGNRRRQHFSLVIVEEDKFAASDLQSIIKVGANLKVNYINCGNAPIASPTAIYKQ